MAVKTDVRGQVSKSGIEPRDDSTFAVESIDYAHHEVHAGTHFFIAQGYNLTTSGNIRTMFLKTGNVTDLCHLVPTIQVNGPGTFRLVEGATNAETPATAPYNNRRPSANTADALWSTGTSAATGGTVLANLIVGGASGAGANTVNLGGNASSREELILKANTLYAFEFTSAADDVDVNYILEWYEHTDKA